MRKAFFIISLLTLTTPFLVSFQTFDTNAKIKAMFVYNFTKYIEWPSSYKTGNFVIGVLGESSLYTELQSMTQTKKAANQPFELKKFSSPADIDQCHMLVVPREEASKIDQVLAKVGGYSTLVITEEDGLAQRGAGINFVVRNNRQKFELNKTKIEKHDLKVSSSLLSLAIVVN